MDSELPHAADGLSGTVVIPTCNRPDLLRVCLAAVEVARARAGLDRIAILVTDDSRDDASRLMIEREFPHVHWVRGPRRGPAANRNTGAAAARGCWLLFTDDDCVPAPDWLAAYARAIAREPAAVAFEGRTVADRARLRLDEESPVNETGGYFWSCNVAIRRATFGALAGFCETFPVASMEDVDFRLRVQAAGHRPVFVPDAVVCHPFRAAKGVRFVVRSGASYLHLVERHPALLGASPWLFLIETWARRTWHLARDGWRYRFRGFGFALAASFVNAWFEIVARVRAASAGSDAVRRR